MTNSIKQIRNLVAQGKLEEAIEGFSSIVNPSSEYYDYVILIKARFSQLYQDRMKGIVTYEQDRIEFNNLMKSFLDLVQDWENQGGFIEYLINQNKASKEAFLDLGNTGLSELPASIGDCTWLKELSLGEGWYGINDSNNNWEFIPSSNDGIKNNIITIPYTIVKLKNLEKLWIVGSPSNIQKLETLPNFSGMEKLKSVYIEYTHIKNFDFLDGVKNLNKLSVSNNHISQISKLPDLKNLIHLNLSYNPIHYTGLLSAFTSLENLNLESTPFIELPSLGNLTDLKKLNLSFVKINNLSAINELSNLVDLNINHTLVTDLSPIQNLKSLKKLSFESTNVNNLEPLKSLVELEEIKCSNTYISDLGVLKPLNKLQKLQVNGTKIENLSSLTSLTNLTEFYAENTLIKQIQSLSELPYLRIFSVKGCDIQDCTTDIWESGDARQLRSYFRKKQTLPAPEKNESTVSEKDYRRDVKLILLGNSASGKTSLLNYLANGDLPADRMSTHGLVVQRWIPEDSRFPLLKDVAVSVWDFGGQEYYHGAYRLFLSANAVYLLMWDRDTDCNGQRETSLSSKEEPVLLEHFEKLYWLDTIRYYGGAMNSAPLLVVQNKTDEEPLKKRISQQTHEEYGIKDSFHISLLKGSEGNRSPQSRMLRYFLEELEQILLTKADEAKVPPIWEDVRQEILVLHDDKKQTKNKFHKALTKNGLWIPVDEFVKTCEKITGKLSPDDKHTLPRWLERGGIIAYFYNTEGLNDKIFLKPNILVKEIYEVLDKDVLKNKGVFEKKDIDKKDHDFPDIFINVAQSLELIFPHPEKEKKDCFIAPQYLPDNHPIEDLFKIAAHGTWQSAIWIKIPLFYYKKILNGLILDFAGDESVEAKHYWKHGIVFLKNKVRVLVKGLYPNEDEHDGKLLIGVENTSQQDLRKDIQQEIFLKCLDLLLNDEKSAGFTPKIDPSKTTITRNWKEELINRLSGKIEDSDLKILSKIEVSYDGLHFGNYPEILKANFDEQTKIISTDKKGYLILREFAPILPKAPKKAKKVFLSYSHQNAKWLNRLRSHLSSLRRSNEIEIWTDQEILPGELWDQTIRERMSSSDVFILLLSADFIASDYIWETELPNIFNRLKEKKAKVIPVLTEPLDLGGLPMVGTSEDGKSLLLSDFQIIPNDFNVQLKPISLWNSPEEALALVAKVIRETIIGMK